jgi:hypothetical protein
VGMELDTNGTNFWLNDWLIDRLGLYMVVLDLLIDLLISYWLVYRAGPTQAIKGRE